MFTGLAAGSIASTLLNFLKLLALIFICSAFLLAIINLISLIVSIVFGNVIGEILALVSMFLPFNASTVFTAIGVAISAILSFMIAKKIFDLTSWSISTV